MDEKYVLSPRALQRNPYLLAQAIKNLGKRIGFTDVRIARPDTDHASTLLKRWQSLDNAGDMHYLQRHGLKRGNIHTITPNALSIISVSLNYLSTPIDVARAELDNDAPYLSVYARGRDYHKILRKMLAQFAKGIETLTEQTLTSRAFVDTAPVLDKAYAEQAGIGWVGKHTNILDRYHGSFYFLGELAINLKLPTDHATKPHCGNCTKCLDVCPTQAITAPYQLDAKRCISYLTIEHKGIIDDTLKPLIGNRIYGCDDCQLLCPWNKYSQPSKHTAFLKKSMGNDTHYATLFTWDENTFLRKTEGTPMRRIGHTSWQRNLAIGMGNCTQKKIVHENIQLLKANRNSHETVKNAVQWAITRLAQSKN